MTIRNRNLLPGELLDFTADTQLMELEISDADINRRYETGEIRIVTEQARYPLSTVPDLVKSGNYILNPEFQRRHRWTNTQKSRLIESLIMNVPIPPIFLYESSYSQFEVMDGLQRLSAISEFYENKFALEDLEEWDDLNGRKYSNLPKQIQKGIDRRYLSSIILLQETAKNPLEAQRLKQIVFERINSGGVNLSPQESRNAIYDGPLNRLCIKLARIHEFCQLWDIPGPTASEEEIARAEIYRTMGDVELVLRFFAGRQRHLRRDQKNYKTFLDSYLRSGNLYPSSVLHGLEEIFLRTIRLVYDVFGERAFWLYRVRNGSWNWLRRATTASYDPMMFVFSQNLDSEASLRENSKRMSDQLATFYQSNYDIFEGRNTNPSVISAREEAFSEFISPYV